MDFKQTKTALVTGAAKGIGRACAIGLAQAGFNIVVHFHHSNQLAADLLNQLRSEGFPCRMYQADITKKEEVDQMIDFCIQNFGTLDVLVNNAGIAESKLFTDILEGEFDHMMNVNLKGPFLCTQSALRYMLPQKEGTIINIASMWGLVGASCEVHYSAAKAGLIGMTKALAKELAPSHIGVNCIAPGAIDTDMMADYSQSDLELLCGEIPMGRLGLASEVAYWVCALAKGGGHYMTGQVISPNGGLVV